LTSINESTTLDDTKGDDDTPQPETSLSATTSPSTNYQPRQPTWGFFNSGLLSTQSCSGDSHSNTFPSRSSLAVKSIRKAARTNHNEVEKKYRDRLNDQFETLAQKLPKEGGEGKGEKRASKTEVLIHAKSHIKELERREKALEDENLELEGAMKDLKRRWVGLGGNCMP
jgi:BMFP domain-containing protein YqiC